MASVPELCKNCRFFGMSTRGNAACKRNPPVVLMNQSATHSQKPVQLTGQDGKPAWGNVSTIDQIASWPTTVWPTVSADDWCGQWEPLPEEQRVATALKEQ